MPVIEYLLGFDVDVNTRLANDDTPLHWAGFYHSNLAITALLNGGGGPELLNGEDKPPLELTRQSGNKKGADLLVRASS